MCITLEPATLASTILVAHQVEHEGKTVNVIGYQNHAENRGSGPNAMILPIPSAAPMTQANCIDMTGAERVFRQYESMFRERTRSMSKGVAVAATNGLEVFDSGSYTVVLTKQFDLKRLRDVLAALPEDKRLDLGLPQMKIFHSFRKLYPGWHLAVCIWSGQIKAEPLLWWYEPMPEYVDKHFLPGLDAHDGNPPDPGLKSVPIDHAIIVGIPPYRGIPPHRGRTEGFRSAHHFVEQVPEHLRKWLPHNVTGRLLHNRQARNGDWVLPKEGWDAKTRFTFISAPRVPPPGYQAA